MRLDAGRREVHEPSTIRSPTSAPPPMRADRRPATTTRGGSGGLSSVPPQPVSRASETDGSGDPHGLDRSTSLRTGIIIFMNEAWIDGALSRMRSESGRSGGARRVVVEYLGRPGLLSSGAGDPRRGSRGRATGRHRERLSRARRVGRARPGAAGRPRRRHLPLRARRPARRPSPPPRLRRLRQGRAVRGPGARAGARSRCRRAGYELAAHDVVLRGACGDCRA